MSRVSQAEARANRQRVVEAASRLFREKGVENVSIVDVMQSVGLTQGGFYKQFSSKEALVDEATAHALTERMKQLTALDEEQGGHEAAWSWLVDDYLSAQHRDDPGDGCPAVGFVADFARELRPRDTYAAGVREMADWVAPGEAGLVALATLVGAVLLARATAGTPVSDEIMKAVRHSEALALPVGAAYST
ncbi:TetR/AcrR family transcriptional regulator [Microbispora sp. ATCC PTA-5024]|uniref:TetR/AcrR family transcriptional regulator n=1 Tax=Microbispora sp. ATCC PTA-5024 TaxID=316330 RepID=UPI0003DC44FB|nr:TetR/AcrR family transcriptional regulator [Microbispora sp. ATCC PTA-5024]ETK32950.1 hypothetical protein MPTA5024_27090 [Microbispora sp. ATCC PTA-5024]